jgi:hypothetical protein
MKLLTSRRSLITGLISLVAAPAIVRASSLMPVKTVLWVPNTFPIVGRAREPVYFEHDLLSVKNPENLIPHYHGSTPFDGSWPLTEDHKARAKRWSERPEMKAWREATRWPK